LHLEHRARVGRRAGIDVPSNLWPDREGRRYVRDVQRFFQHIVHGEIELLQHFFDIGIGLSHLRFHVALPDDNAVLIYAHLT